MGNQKKYEDFRADFMTMMRRFGQVAPAAVKDSGRSAAISLHSARVVSLLEQALPDDDGGELTGEDFAFLDKSIQRGTELLDVLEPLTAIADARQGAFDDFAFSQSLQALSPDQQSTVMDVMMLSRGGLGKKDVLDALCSIEGIGDLLDGMIIEFFKKNLIGIISRLVPGGVLVKKVADLIPGFPLRFIDDIIGGGGDGPGQIPPGGGVPLPPLTPPRPAGFVLKLENLVPQGFDIIAGTRAVITFETYDGLGNAVIRLDATPAFGGIIPNGLNAVGLSTAPIPGARRFRVTLDGSPGATACVRVSFV